jgi:hypothetical protein
VPEGWDALAVPIAAYGVRVVPVDVAVEEVGREGNIN